MVAATEAAEAKTLAEELWAEGEIDDPANWDGAPVYIFSGTTDAVVHPTRQDTQYDLYTSLGSNVDYQ